MPNRTDERQWLLLRDELTGEPKGYVNAHGETRDADAETRQRIAGAFSRELLVRDGEVVEELGMCFDGVCSIGPADPSHDALVLRNLGALSGLRPERIPPTGGQPDSAATPDPQVPRSGPRAYNGERQTGCP